jgi:hypothetical protein
MALPFRLESMHVQSSLCDAAARGDVEGVCEFLLLEKPSSSDNDSDDDVSSSSLTRSSPAAQALHQLIFGNATDDEEMHVNNVHPEAVLKVLLSLPSWSETPWYVRLFVYAAHQLFENGRYLLPC